jgi:hypothetical protein
MRIGDGQKKREDEESHTEPDGELGQHMGRLGTEDVLRHAATECGSESLTTRQLHENDEHQQEAHEYVNGKQNWDEQPHIENRGKCGIGRPL